MEVSSTTSTRNFWSNQLRKIFGANVKLPERRLVSLLLVIAIALLAVGCTGRFSAQGGWSGPLISEDTVYVGTRDGRLLALDKKTGATKWEFPPSEDDNIGPVYGTPALDENGRLYVGGYDGNLYAIDTSGIKSNANVPSSGEALLFSTDGSIVASPVVVQDTVLVASSDGFLYSVDARDGELKWKFKTNNKAWSTPVVDRGRVYFGSLDHTLYAVDLNSGEAIWKFLTKGAIASKPLVRDRQVYVGTFEGILYALDRATGREMARFEAGNWFWGAPISHDSRIYVGSLDHKLYALDAKSLKEVWPEPFETGDQIIGAPTIVGDWIAVPSVDKNLYIVRLENGGDKRTCMLDSSVKAPLASEGDIVYVVATDNSVRAIRINSNGDPNELWTRYTNKEEPEPRTAEKAC